MRPGWLFMVSAALVLTGCTAESEWRPVELGAIQPASLAAAGDDLLVGGSSDGGPALARIDASGQVFPLTAVPDGPEAEAAELVYLAVRGDAVQALGKMISGAHSNPRWTVWDGSLSAGSVTSHPQEFFTFGGHDAGPLLGAGWVAGSPAILGSRTTATGARAALYQSSGTTWRELSDRPGELASTATSQLGFSALASTGEGLVIAGDEVVLSQPLQQRPLVWVGRPDGSWTRLEPSTPTTDGSGLARAQAAACTSDGSCWVAGWVHGQLLAWLVTTGDQSSVGAAEQLSDTPGTGDPDVVATIWGGRAVVAGNGSAGSVQVRCSSGWRPVRLPDRNGDGSNTVQPSQSNSQEPSPPTAVTGLAAVGERLYVLRGSTLWVTDHSPC